MALPIFLSGVRKGSGKLQGQIRSLFHTVSGSQLTYSEYGDPAKVLKLETFKIEAPPGTDQVLVKMLAATLNPADMNTIQGTYAVKPTLPSIPGNEGVGVVSMVGSGVSNLKPGDWVLPRKNAWGTWRTHAICPSNDLIRIPEMDLASAATIGVNPGTAYRMLHDFHPLAVGDTVIQNGGNSAVGQAVIQMCKAMGVNTVNVVRHREGIDDLKKWLIGMGATCVLTEDELRTTTIFKEGLRKPKLGFNCIGGKNALDVMRHLDNGGILVTYGGMSRQPLTAPTSALIFKDLHLVGFWMTRWNWEHEKDPKRDQMMDYLAGAIKRGELKPPTHRFVALKDYQQAMASAADQAGFQGCKIIFRFD